ncbi:hypothetical protein QBC39DRAFT_345916 [Podospora conica]|nr:hypothetical protein QBC39DRAFT_345916 [Schizothecium conicum]
MWQAETIRAAVVETAAKAGGSRYIDNQTTDLLDSGDTEAYLEAALEDIVTNFPPKHRYSPETLHGLWSGPTGIGYLLLQVSARRPDLVIYDKPMLDWAWAYMRGSRGYNLRRGCHGCGITDERLAYEAVLSAVSKDMQHVRAFAASATQVTAVDDFPDENLYGRAGLLYLLRLVRHWVPESARLVTPIIAEVSDTILRRGPDWAWHGHRYLGAAHGDIGIIVQLVLTSPELAPQLEPVLERLLDEQLPGGNWHVSLTLDRKGKELVQFCHGAPGFVVSLLSLRHHFPNMESRINQAVDRARSCIWREGLLTKEPNLCHGIFGNALALPRGGQREHFLGVASPDNVSRVKSADANGKVFQRADYGRGYSTLTSYAPSAVWTWLVYRDEAPSVLGYNDV